MKLFPSAVANNNASQPVNEISLKVQFLLYVPHEHSLRDIIIIDKINKEVIDRLFFSLE